MSVIRAASTDLLRVVAESLNNVCGLKPKIVQNFGSGIWERGEPAVMNRSHWVCFPADGGGLDVTS
jgi:hypothetical protein